MVQSKITLDLKCGFLLFSCISPLGQKEKEQMLGLLSQWSVGSRFNRQCMKVCASQMLKVKFKCVMVASSYERTLKFFYSFRDLVNDSM